PALNEEFKGLRSGFPLSKMLSSMDSTSKRRATILICLLLAITTLATYSPLFHAEFIHFDDPSYVTTNPRVSSGLSWENIEWAFTSGYASNWHPLTWLSHMMDAQLFGLKPAGHHSTNVLLHTINVLLVFLAFKSM